MTDRKLRIGVGALTRRRPQMFAALLQSLARMARPEDAEVVFLFAENDDALSVQAEAEKLRHATGCRVRAETEPRPGIPIARNRVLDMALEEGCDLLTFVDDDETVREDWLVALVGTAQTRGLDLVGGPVAPGRGDQPLDRLQAACLSFLQARSKKRTRVRAAQAEAGRDGDQNIYTNNWCARLSTVQRLGVRFEESLQFTGGSDTRFSLDMAAAGARIGWAPGAIVDEVVPLNRLTLAYQFSRARDQSANGVRLRGIGAAQAIPFVALRLVDAVLNIAVTPVAGRLYLVKGVHKLGMAAGRLRGLAGLESRHYAPGTERVHGEGPPPAGRG